MRVVPRHNHAKSERHHAAPHGLLAKAQRNGDERGAHATVFERADQNWLINPFRRALALSMPWASGHG